MVVQNKFFLTNATNNNENEAGQGFVTKNPNSDASNCKGEFFSSWMLKNPNVNCQLGSNSSFHLSTLHFIENAHRIDKHKGW